MPKAEPPSFRTSSRTPPRLSKNRRKLQISTAGKWYIVLTIGIGVVALTSGNNVLYLIESLLLSGLILSGILSERTISAVQVDIRREAASAGEACLDRIVIRNLKRNTVFCIDICEWKDGKFTTIAFVPKLGPKASVVVKSQQSIEKRGIYSWDGIAIATSYPFGFARKLKVVPGPGERLVWPKRSDRSRSRIRASEHTRVSVGPDMAEGEVRAFSYDDDARLIVWPLSARGATPVVRQRKTERESPDVMIDLRARSGPEFERLIERTATPFYQFSTRQRGGSLILRDWQGQRKIQGSKRALDALALAEAAGSPADSARKAGS